MLPYTRATVLSEHLTWQKALCRFISTSVLHCTQNYQMFHFGKLIQDMNLFQTTGKSSLLPLLFFCIKPCSTYVLHVPVQKQRWTQRIILPSDLHDESIPCLFKMRWGALKTELSKLNNGGCRLGPPMLGYLRRHSLWHTSLSLWSNPVSPLCML